MSLCPKCGFYKYSCSCLKKEDKVPKEFEHSVVARVRLTIDIPVRSSWGADCTMAQIYKQAEQDAQDMLRQFFEKNNLIGRACVIGEPKVTAVLASNKE